jgi:cytochrome c556
MKGTGMVISRALKCVGAMVLFSAVIFAPTAAMTQDGDDMQSKAIATRQGLMKLVLWEAGPLFGMAKGEMDYDADAARAHAADLAIITQYPFPDLFLEGSSNEARPGKTRALPKIWEDMSGFAKAYSDFRSAVAALGDKVGNGQPELAAAVGEVGKTCGGCHKPYRAKEF